MGIFQVLGMLYSSIKFRKISLGNVRFVFWWIFHGTRGSKGPLGSVGRPEGNAELTGSGPLSPVSPALPLSHSPSLWELLLDEDTAISSWTCVGTRDGHRISSLPCRHWKSRALVALDWLVSAPAQRRSPRCSFSVSLMRVTETVTETSSCAHLRLLSGMAGCGVEDGHQSLVRWLQADCVSDAQISE